MKCQVSFTPETHIYRNVKTQEQYESVTTLLARYKNKFEKERIAKEYVVNHPELGFKDWKEVVKHWDSIRDAALDKGNKYHNTQELTTILKDSKVEHQDYNDNLSSLEGLNDGVYPELRTWLHKYKKAGTVDKTTIETIDNIRWVDIEDYKTNRKPLSYRGFKDQMMLEILRYLPDASYYHYEMQLNIYGYFLEQYGYKVRSLKIRHKRFLDDQEIPEEFIKPWGNREEQIAELKREKVIVVPYFPLRVKTLLEYDSKKRSRLNGDMQRHSIQA